MTRLMTTALFAGAVLAGAPAVATAEELPPVLPMAAPPPAPSPPLIAGPAYGPPPTTFVGERYYRSPGLAAALSLQPLPIDFGNLYAENLGWGIAYTAIETSLLAPMMWMTGEHMDHGTGTSTDRNWSGMEQGAMMGFLSGYVVVKIVASVHAGYAAQRFNESYAPRGMALIAPAREGAVIMWSGSL